MMLRVVLAIDCERFTSFKQGNPRWHFVERMMGKVNNLIKNWRYNKGGFELVYATIQKEKFPCTMMLVGNLFERPEDNKVIEWGYHTLNHRPLTLIDDQSLAREVKNQWKLKSITAPMWMIEDTKNPKRIFDMIKGEGYTHTVYKGKNEGIKHFHILEVKKPENKQGIKCVHLSNYFEGNSTKERINEIKRDISANLGSGGVYLLSTHDFTHRNNKNLLEIIHFLKQMKEEKKIKILRLKEVK